MEFIRSYMPTSKAQLVQVAMTYYDGDLKKAQEMFDFYAKNIDLPDFDLVAPTLMQQIKTNAADIFSWFKENQGDIVQGYQLVQSIIKNKGVFSTVADDTAEALPSINE